jgi:hypothetical protein
MSYTIKNIFTRPDTSVDWFLPDGRTDVINALNNFERTNTTTESDNGLTLTTEVVWVNKASWDEMRLDETCAQFFIDRETYNTNNNIVYNTTFSES